MTHWFRNLSLFVLDHLDRFRHHHYLLFATAVISCFLIKRYPNVDLLNSLFKHLDY